MRAIVELILVVLNLYWYVVVAQVILSWLIAFGVVNTYNKFVAQIGEVLYRLTEPLLRPIRNTLPNLGGVDISPVVLLILLWFVERVIVLYVLPQTF